MASQEQAGLPSRRTEQVPPGDKQRAGALTCWRAGPDCRGPVEVRWADAEQWESLPVCERHYAEWRRETIAINAAIDAALDDESSVVPETSEASEAETSAAPAVPTQSREPGAPSTPAQVEVDEKASHIHDDGVSFWYDKPAGS
jgi:hypothetical protein